MKNRSNLPHSLRIIILLLRIVLGLDFFYLGFGSLFNLGLGRELGARTLASLYPGISVSVPSAPIAQYQTIFQWALLVIGGCLVVGLFTRFASVMGIALTLAVYLPTISFAAVTAPQFINDEVLVIVCLLVLFAANAGSYLGIDTFIHIHFAPWHKKSD